MGPIASIHVRHWHDYLTRRGHSVHVFSGEPLPDGVAGGDGDRLRFPGLPKSVRYSLGALQLRAVIRRTAPDVVHVQSLGANALLAPAIPRRLLVVTLWGSDVVDAMKNPVRRLVMRDALRRAALVLTTSRAMSGVAIDEIGAAPDRVRTVSWGVDTELFVPGAADERSRIRQSFGLPTGGTLFTAIRTSERTYRTLEVIRAFAAALGSSADRHLAIVAGFESNDPRAREEQRRYREAIRREASAVRGSAISFIRGHLSQVEYAALLRASDVAISVPESDQRSSSVLEALASGTTVVLSDLAPYRELVADGYHAHVIEDPMEIGLTRWLRDPEFLSRREVAENVSLIARTESRREQFREIEEALVSVASRHRGGRTG